MVQRDVTLSSLFDVRRKLGELIVSWSPDPEADPATQNTQREQLNALILERDQINGAINAVIATEFAGIPSPALTQATQDLQVSAEKLDALGKTIAEINDVLKIADAVLQGAAMVIKLATGGLPV